MQTEHSLPLAESGIVVASIEFRTSETAPHSAALEDINYATRWLRANATEYKVIPQAIGLIGFSSGGHLVMLAGMRSDQFAGLPLEGGAGVDATVAFVIMGWPVINPFARHRFAQETGRKQTCPAPSRVLWR